MHFVGSVLPAVSQVRTVRECAPIQHTVLPHSTLTPRLIVTPVLKRGICGAQRKHSSRSKGNSVEALDCLLEKKCVLSICRVFLSTQISRLKMMCLSQRREVPDTDWAQITSPLPWVGHSDRAVGSSNTCLHPRKLDFYASLSLHHQGQFLRRILCVPEAKTPSGSCNSFSSGGR